MSPDNLLSVSDIVSELKTNKAIVKFILKRFQHLFQAEEKGGQPLYPARTLKLVAVAQEKIDMGMIPSQIEKELKTMSHSDSSTIADLTENEDIRLSKDGLKLLSSLFNEIGEQQKRIAAAHEKRAAAEERKAVAIEKRADAEEKKAAAMNNIAAALQEMNSLRRSIGLEPEQIAHQAVSILTEDEKTDDDLQEEAPDEPLDDLSLLLDKKTGVQEDQENPEMPEELDDLSKLLDDDNIKDIEVDDLSQLIDPVAQDPSLLQEPLDDLSLLIDTVSKEPAVEEQMDDLSLLIDAPPQAPAAGNSPEVQPEEIPTIRVDADPDDVETYKAAIMKLIIGLKTEGTVPEKATRILNANNIKTLSGKPEWSIQAITQIYKFIESAA